MNPKQLPQVMVTTARHRGLCDVLRSITDGIAQCPNTALTRIWLVEPDAIVLGWWDTVPGVQYLQLVEGQRPDVLAINRFLISGDDMAQLIEENAAQRPIYINNPPVEFLRTLHVEPVGSLYRLYP